MRRNLLAGALVAVFGSVMVTAVVHGQAAQTPPAAQAPNAAQAIQQLKPGFYLVTGAGGNASVRVTNQGIILVDTKNLGDPFYNALVEQIKTVTNQPVKTVFITHVHQDHAGNIERFVKAGAEVITHSNLTENLKTYQSNAGVPGKPSMTYDRDHVVTLGGARAEAHHYASGHTSGDTVVHFPDLRIVAMGDELVQPQAPNVDYTQGGSIFGLKRSLDYVSKLDFDIAIPGHGNPMTKAEFMAYKTKVDTFTDRAMEAIKKGVTKDQLMTSIKQDDLGWGNGMQMAPGPRLDGFYTELSQAR